jgi:hypothetical protein
MALNLIELIRASGGAGISGQSFRSNVAVPPLPDGRAVSHYRLNSIAFTGEPTTDISGTYPSSRLFNITATFNAGPAFGLIQRNTSSAWTFTIVGGAGASATLETWSSNGGGVSHELGLRVLGALTGTPTMNHVAVSNDVGGEGPWTVTWTASPQNLGGEGSALLEIIPTYDPDLANFNPVLIYDGTSSWRGNFDNRGYNAVTDFDYEWRTANSGGGVLISTNRSFTLTTDIGWFNGSENVGRVYPTAWEYPDSPYSGNNGLLPGETSQPIYLYWRVKPSSGGNGVWQNYGPITHQDPRSAL